MRPAASILFLFLLLGYLGGIPIAFTIYKHGIRQEIKQQVKRGLPQHALHPISFSRSDLATIDWVENGEEFRFDGSMYDIVSARETKDSVHYLCINDREEETLFQNVGALARKQFQDDCTSRTRPAGKILRALVVLLYLPPAATTECRTIEPTTTPYAELVVLLRSYIPAKQAPPPKQHPSRFVS